MSRLIESHECSGVDFLRACADVPRLTASEAQSPPLVLIPIGRCSIYVLSDPNHVWKCLSKKA